MDLSYLTPDIEQFIFKHNQNLESTLVQSSQFNSLKNNILDILQSDKNIPYCEEHEGKMYHFFQSELYPKGVYRVCSAASYRAGIPKWRILFSVADFDSVLNEDVFFAGIIHYTLKPTNVLIMLAPNGQDAKYTIEFDLLEQKIVESGFHFPLGKNHISWKDEDSVWVCPAWDQRQITESGYPSEVWLMNRGQSFSEATPIFKTDPKHLLANAWRYLDGQGSPIDIIEEAKSFFQKKYYVITQNLETVPIKIPESAVLVGYLDGQLLIHLQQDWQRASHLIPAGSLIAVVLNKGNLGQAHILFAPNERQTIEMVETTRSYIVLHYLDNVHSFLKSWFWQDGAWKEHHLPELPPGTIEFIDQPWGGNLMTLSIENFLMPPTLFSLDLTHNELTVLRKAPKLFDSSHFKIKQHFAKSQDGTSVPYFWVGNPNLMDSPTLIYTYGGFSVPELPYYLENFGKHWLEKGGTFVLANVRGGGEFGPKWHQTAQKQNKHKSVDDLIAVIDDLVDTKKTKANKIALQGGSNGGLLVASVYARAPEKVKAVICEAPLIDMENYTSYASGRSWIEEYGDPAIPHERTYLANLSPLNNLKSGIKYPTLLLTTSLSDDRVHPLHAILFAQKIENLEHEVNLYTSNDGGHTGNDTQEMLAHELALLFTFLYHSFDMV